MQKFEAWMVYTNSKVKGKLNNVAISKSLWLLEKVFWIYHMKENITLLSREGSLTTCQGKSLFEGFFS